MYLKLPFLMAGVAFFALKFMWQQLFIKATYGRGAALAVAHIAVNEDHVQRWVADGVVEARQCSCGQTQQQHAQSVYSNVCQYIRWSSYLMLPSFRKNPFVVAHLEKLRIITWVEVERSMQVTL